MSFVKIGIKDKKYVIWVKIYMDNRVKARLIYRGIHYNCTINLLQMWTVYLLLTRIQVLIDIFKRNG